MEYSDLTMLQFREALARLYKNATLATDRINLFADRARLSPSAVEKMYYGQRKVPGPAQVLIETWLS